jgi:DNA mismatch repair protein MutL
VALAFPNIFFSLTSNGQQLFHLEAVRLKQRIVQLLGNNYNAKAGSGKRRNRLPECVWLCRQARNGQKNKGRPVLFCKQPLYQKRLPAPCRDEAYQEMIPHDSFPMYVLFIDLDPAQVDVNVHPTKQEIKFEDEKIVYAFVQAAVKHALAQFSITPTLDFELDATIQELDSIQKPFTQEKQSSAKSSSIFQTFTEAHQARPG